MRAMNRDFGDLRHPPGAAGRGSAETSREVWIGRSPFVLLTWLLMVSVAPAGAQSLRGSPASLDIQNRIAREHDYTYIESVDRVRYFVEQGWLVEVEGSRDLTLHAVSFPYARPELALFLERLARQYRAACGERLVVTSLTRPQNRQPRNASERSVHPTGMAIDLRLPRNATCRSWLEGVLASLERARVLEATRERSPAHYHVAVFPRQYTHYLERTLNVTPRLRQATPVRTSAVAYEVRPGDSLWTIARAFDTSVELIQAQNEMGNSRIYAGQLLEIPSSSR